MLVRIDSFISESQRLDLLCTAHSAADSDWSIRIPGGGGEYWVGNRYPFQSPIFDDLNKQITKHFQGFSSISPFCGIQRIGVGNGMGEHSDNYHETCNFGCVVYLNDNFEGGDLFYPRLNKTVKPVSGALVIHAGDEPHMVTTVTRGVRYMLTCFVYGHPNQKAELIFQ